MAKSRRIYPDCLCFTCHKLISPYGIANHRKAHLSRGESCSIRYTHGNLIEHSPRPKEKK